MTCTKHIARSLDSQLKTILIALVDMSSNRRNQDPKSTTGSLTALRLLLQDSINQEIDQIMQRYIKQYIEPAAENIEMNQKLGVIATNGIPPKQCVKDICKKILDEAKKMY